MNFSDFDHDYLTNSVTRWIGTNEDFFLPNIDEQRRFHRSKKINYWQMPCGEMLWNPEISDPHSRIVR